MKSRGTWQLQRLQQVEQPHKLQPGRRKLSSEIRPDFFVDVRSVPNLNLTSSGYLVVIPLTITCAQDRPG